MLRNHGLDRNNDTTTRNNNITRNDSTFYYWNRPLGADEDTARLTLTTSRRVEQWSLRMDSVKELQRAIQFHPVGIKRLEIVMMLGSVSLLHEWDVLLACLVRYHAHTIASLTVEMKSVETDCCLNCKYYEDDLFFQPLVVEPLNRLLHADMLPNVSSLHFRMPLALVQTVVESWPHHDGSLHELRLFNCCSCGKCCSALDPQLVATVLEKQPSLSVLTCSYLSMYVHTADERDRQSWGRIWKAVNKSLTLEEVMLNVKGCVEIPNDTSIPSLTLDPVTARFQHVQEERLAWMKKMLQATSLSGQPTLTPAQELLGFSLACNRFHRTWMEKRFTKRSTLIDDEAHEAMERALLIVKQWHIGVVLKDFALQRRVGLSKVG